MNAVRVFLILVVGSMVGCLDKATEQAPTSSTLSCSDEVFYEWVRFTGNPKSIPMS